MFNKAKAQINTSHQTGGTNNIHQHFESDLRVIFSFGGILLFLVIVLGAPFLCYAALFTHALDFLK